MQRLGRKIQCMGSDRCEVLAPLHWTQHQALQPRILELLASPELRQRGTLAGEQALRKRRDRLHIEQRPVRVEDQRIDREGRHGVGNHRSTSLTNFLSSYAKIARMSHVDANVAKKIGVTLACNPLVPWWAILGSNQ